MRVLYFTRDYTTHDRRFLVKLSESEHEVFALRLEDDGICYESRPVPDNVRIIEWRGGRVPLKHPHQWLEMMPDFCRVLDEIRPDLIHAGPIQSCGFMTALSGFHPFLLMSWGSDLLVDAHRDGLWNWITKYTLAQADALFCDCKTVEDEAKARWHYNDRTILKRSWGVDLKTFSSGPDRLGIKDRLGWQEAFVILSTRTWEPIYGIDVLLPAFARAHSQNPELRLLLLGDGSQSGEVKQWISRHELSESIHCPGIVSHEALPDYFRAANLYVSCSYSDGSSVSLLEALATGLPVVATNCGGNHEWITSRKNGWLCRPGEPGDFADQFLNACALNEEERSGMRQANRALAERFADWDANFAKAMELYDVLDGRRKIATVSG